jgi:DNA-binding winged helix-turn-helix (wHTH) protein
VERHGQLVEKEELMTRLWPDTFVEEGNVLRNVSTLRKALGDGEEGSKFIETIPRRGYRFVASVEVLTNGKVPAAEGLGAEAASGVRSGQVQPTERRRHALLLAGVIVLAGLAGLVWWLTAGRAASES